METAAINIIDIVVFVVILASALVAFMRGFIHEFLSILGWLGGLTLGFFGSYYFKPYAMQFIKHELLAQIVCGVVIFIVSMFILSYIANSISKSVRKSQLNAVDRTLGFVFGFVRGFVLVVLALMIVEFVWPLDKYPDLVKNARLLPIFQNASKTLGDFLGQYVVYVPAPASTDQKTSQSKALQDAIEARRAQDIEEAKKSNSKTQDLKEKVQAKLRPKEADKKESVAEVPKKESARPKDGYKDADRIDLENLFDEADGQSQ